MSYVSRHQTSEVNHIFLAVGQLNYRPVTKADIASCASLRTNLERALKRQLAGYTYTKASTLLNDLPQFLLGYADNRGYLPISPSVPATADPHQILPAVREGHAGELPNFSKIAANGPRDLGKNGSYLVIRQLVQDVDLFNQFLTTASAGLLGRPGVPPRLTPDQIRERLGAKMIGRWKDGTSLVRYPHAPGSGWTGATPVAPDNTFLLGAEDPLGESCPYGSHIRRTNPRDSLTPGSKAQLGISNRHRILRVGVLMVRTGPDNRQPNRGCCSCASTPTSSDNSSSSSKPGPAHVCFTDWMAKWIRFWDAAEKEAASRFPPNRGRSW